MRTSKIVLGLGLTSLTCASRLFVSSYSGNITTVELTEKDNGVDLKAIFQSQGCAPSPSWLEYHGKTSTLFCADEGFPTPDHANFASFKVNADGSLKSLDQLATLNGGVNTVTYMLGKEKYMAIAHYGGSGITIVNTTDPLNLGILKTYVFTFGTQVPAGSDPAKPAVPFIHQVVVDPTGKFLLAPDLSADLTHVFGFSLEDGLLTDPIGQEPLRVHQGSGPRHLVFYQPDGKTGKTYLYIVLEKKNMLHGSEVVYTEKGTLEFKNVYMSSIFGGEELPVGSAAAEIKLTPDNKYLIISSRMDKLSPPGSLDPKSPSDTLITFSLDSQTGIPKLLERTSAGGLGPRSFAINRAGDRVAVALNGQNKLVIFKRDAVTGKFSGQLGSLDLDVGDASGLVSSVVWDEETADDIVVAASETGPVFSTTGPQYAISSSVEAVTTTNTTIMVTKTVTQSECEADGCSDLLPTLTSTLASTPSSAGITSSMSSLPKDTGSPASIPIPEVMPSWETNSWPVATRTMTSSPSPISDTVTFHSASRFLPLDSSSSTRTPTSVANPTPAMIESSAGTSATPTESPISTPIMSSTVSSNLISSALSDPSVSSVSPTQVDSSTGGVVYTLSTIQLTATPSPVNKAITEKCKHFYEVVDDDDCDRIYTMNHVSKETFVEWNPNVQVDCTNLIAGEWVCVGV
ncbi:hypothetical protein VTL71DRAFT_8431 [Oculimacula yallundae]|uniref:LysM domain-containing protein n=1 Tax=Oculimacula yallundae TaxID=86028 RepID=A0ABR4CXR4_9HELO